jgi:hypothetical protein
LAGFVSAVGYKESLAEESLAGGPTYGTGFGAIFLFFGSCGCGSLAYFVWKARKSFDDWRQPGVRDAHDGGRAKRQAQAAKVAARKKAGLDKASQRVARKEERAAARNKARRGPLPRPQRKDLAQSAESRSTVEEDADAVEILCWDDSESNYR